MGPEVGSEPEVCAVVEGTVVGPLTLGDGCDCAPFAILVLRLQNREVRISRCCTRSFRNLESGWARGLRLTIL
jgi:hypothetical protein